MPRSLYAAAVLGTVHLLEGCTRSWQGLPCCAQYLSIVQVWDPVTGKLKKDLTYQAEELFMMHEEAVLALAFNRESSVLVSGEWVVNHQSALAHRRMQQQQPLVQ